MKKIKYRWCEDEQCPQSSENYPSINIDDNPTNKEIEKIVRQAVFENFEWGYYVGAKK